MTAPGPAISFVGVTDLDLAADFYGAKLGLTLRDESPFALVSDNGGVGGGGDGAMLRITKVDEVIAAPYTVLGWAVDDIAASVSELTARGIRFARYDFVEQDELGVWTTPGGDKVAWLLDPFGNNLSLTEFSK